MTHLPHPLVSARRLAARIEAGERFHLLDVRWALGQPSMHEAYLHAHLPGACWVEFEDALSDAVSDDGAGGRHPMPSLDRFQDAMRAAGVRNDVPVVVYDAANGLAAARCWWLLRYFGKLDVQVLDGGLAAWKQAGGALEGGDPTPTQRGDFIATPRHLTLVDADGAEELAARHLLVDARPADRFAGQNETIDPVAGHIPGAVNIPALSNVGPDGRFLSTDDLADAAGSVPDDASCVAAVAAPWKSTGSLVTATGAHTTDPDQALRVADKIEAGMVFVNAVGAEGAELPFGGVKRSGFGRELGNYGVDEFVNKRLVRVSDPVTGAH